LQALAGEIVRTEQRERQRIAQLLHDQIQQLLVATLYGLEGLREARRVSDSRQSAAKLSGLVRDCIAMSRSLMSELSHPSFTEPDLGTALGWLGAWVKEKHGLEVTIQCAQPIAVAVEETRVTLLQSVRELLFNIVKHAGVREAHVDLARGTDGSVRVTVRDAGAGFDPEKARVVGPTSGGFGLFSVRERLDVIGGGMKIESAIGRGSSVTVWVPPDPAESADSSRSLRTTTVHAPTPSETTSEKSGRKNFRSAKRTLSTTDRKIRVVLVDDHAVVRDGLALQLQQQPDIEIVGEAADGQAALDLVRVLRPDVVTMDVNMPVMNGIDAARAIHAEFPQTRIIGLSMLEDAEQGAAMRNAGAMHYLSKSASLDTLLAAIRDPSGLSMNDGSVASATTEETAATKRKVF
jgi:CheY-like chemotaxis protein